MPNPVEEYIRNLHLVRSSGAGVDETSHYGTLGNLLNEIGKKLKPRVRSIINLQNAGAGLPDGGLFTADQFPRPKAEPRQGQLPARGAIEAKGTGEDLRAAVDTKQVRDYVARYGSVLLTNYRSFLLLERRPEGGIKQLEGCQLAEDEAQFWAASAHARKVADKHGERLVEYLKRVMLRKAPLAEPKDVAWFLASYARDAKVRVEERKDLPELAAIRSALEDALGMKFEGEKGEHFFRSTLVQTLFYGVFSAWVLWDKHHKGDPAARFNWHEAGWYLHVPMISALFQQISSRAQLGPLDIAEVLDWTGDTLNRVNRGEFFSKFEEGHAVQYFYEPFLQAFDPELRKELGVWYTPPEVVQYMVERVDRVLRSELSIADGLADPNVYVLDPCCGTGAYLVEVLNRIQKTLREKGGDALAAQDLKKAAIERVFGFEILPAPFVISHLQLGLLLQNLGAPLSDAGGERAGVFLTNALTGWEPPQGEKKRLPFIELEQERDAAEKVKQEVPILVILGNPPYNAFAGVSPAEEGGLVEPYKAGLISKWGIKKFNLDDVYVRFFRLAERRIAEKTGRGVVCYISNCSWIFKDSFVVLREHLLRSFDRFWLENMHGDRTISEYAPDGRTSETIFAIPGFSVGIQQGVAISLWVKTGQDAVDTQVLFRDDLDTAKAMERRAQLLASLGDISSQSHYTAAEPEGANKFSFRPSVVGAYYSAWPLLPDLAAIRPLQGLDEDRGLDLIDTVRDALVSRMKCYLDASRQFEDLRSECPGLTRDGGRYIAEKAREKLLAAETFLQERIVRYYFRSLDVRWCYYTAVRPIWKEPRPDLWPQIDLRNSFLLSRPSGVADPEGIPMTFTSSLFARDAMRGHAVGIPLMVLARESGRKSKAHRSLDSMQTKDQANLSLSARAYLAWLGISDPDADDETAGLIWMHALAIGYSPAYLNQNADGIRRDWPRIPLPDSKEALLASAELGRKVAALLDTEKAVPGVTSGDIRKELREIAVISRDGGGALDPAAGDLAVTAGWGHAGKGAATMPGSGELVKRAYSPEEAAAMRSDEGAGDTLLPYGESTLDVYLNDVAYWRNVPEGVWQYRIGGYQVMKKWLSYREEKLLRRSLTMDEAREVTNIARRIAAILLLEPDLDENYRETRADPFPWPEVAGE